MATIRPSHELSDVEERAFRSGIQSFFKGVVSAMKGEECHIVMLQTDMGDYVLGRE
jgi:hypothetical protein